MGENITNIKLAIIVPTCNREKTLKYCVDSCLKQMESDDMIIVVNDGEPGSVKPFDDKRIAVYEHCKPYFASASARNWGIREAIYYEFEYGLFIDDDIIVGDGAIQAHKESLASTENKKTLHVGKIFNVGDRIDVRERNDGSGLLKWGGMVNSSLHLYEFLAAGAYNEDFDGEWGFGDTDCFNRLTKAYGWDIVRVNAESTHLRNAPGAQYYSRSRYANNEKLFNRLLEMYEKRSKTA